jgi:hypothetical protein
MTESITITRARQSIIATKNASNLREKKKSKKDEGTGIKYFFRSINAAVNVVVATNSRGTKVIQIYLALPILMIMVVPIQRASIPNSWLAVPKIGQIEDIEPVRIRYPQAMTTTKLAAILPINELKFPKGL